MSHTEFGGNHASQPTAAGPAAHRAQVTDVDCAVDFAAKYPPGRPLTGLDGADLCTLLRGAYDWLAVHREQVNRLNVFPVPDGDTGTNMLLTMQSAWAEIAAAAGQPVSRVIRAAADGAHRGSRGNSGVILGRILQGMSERLAGVSLLTARDLAAALASAAETAYRSVPTPVEGTILTVIRESADALAAVAERQPDIRELLQQLVASADQAVRNTPNLLPVLKKAGVVDSGGKGLCLLFEGMYRVLVGLPVGDERGPAAAELEGGAVRSAALKGRRSLPPQLWGFDVQFLVEYPNRPLEEIRADVGAMGDCVLVEGDQNLVKVHVHLPDPGLVLSYGVHLGFVTDVVVENMDDMAASAQLDLLLQDQAEPLYRVSDAGHRISTQNGVEATDIGLVAVSPGPGLDRVLLSLGVHCLVSGGQTMNPSTQELMDAVLELPSKRVILLPNNGNIVLAAGQAAELLAAEPDARQVEVVPSRTIPQGIAALIAFDPHAADLAELVGGMCRAMAGIQTGEVTHAVRDAEFDGLAVTTGEVIGLHDGRLVVKGVSVHETVLALLEQMEAESSEIITVYYGIHTPVAQAEALAAQLAACYVDQDVELISGGQPYYDYILSTE